MTHSFRLIFVILGFCASLWAQGVVAQPVNEKILIIDPEQMFSRSDYGIRILGEIEAKTQALIEENTRIETELVVEEQALSDERPSLEPAEFRAKADQFDAKVEEIRARQNQKSVELNQWVDSERQRFFQGALPVLLELTRELGASVILDRRTVFLSAENVDVTLLAVERINAAIGDRVNIEE